MAIYGYSHLLGDYAVKVAVDKNGLKGHKSPLWGGTSKR